MKQSYYVRNKHKKAWYLHDIVGILLAMTAFFMLLCLLSYNPYDHTWFYATTAPHLTTNWCGTIGAHVAVLLIYFFGSSSLYGIMGLGWCAYACIVTKSYAHHADRVGALFILMCTSAAWCCAYQIDFLGTSFFGGLVGNFIYRMLYQHLDSVGTLICIHTLFLICLILITRLSLIHSIAYLLRLLKSSIAYMIQTQPSISRFFSSIRIACGHMHNWWITYTKKIRAMLWPDNNVSMYEYTAYTNEGFDDALYDTTVWNFEREKTIDSMLTEEVVESKMQSPVLQETTSTPVCLYQVPDRDMFKKRVADKADAQQTRHLKLQADLLEEKLARFGIGGTVTSIKQGPVVTLFEYQPTIDSKISKITALEHDLALALQAISIRIIAPIPGTCVVGFEVPNKHTKEVLFSTVIHCPTYTQSALLPLILGQDTIGRNVIVDLAAMPHLLVAGSTGSGKSVALNSMLMSLLCACTPEELQLILIDPKRLEFALYADIAHLVFPIITEPHKACLALTWVVKEMETRYTIMAGIGAKNCQEYNKDATRPKMAYIVVIIDELADLMITAGKDVEMLITRIAQMARAAGIHIIVATQRPSVDVITGLIKANFPSRISFRVASKIDSRTILDVNGADTLLGRGDMLFLDSRSSSLRRIHGAYVSDQEIENVVTYIRSQKNVIYRDLMEEVLSQESLYEQKDELYDEVLLFLKGVNEISISLLQRKFRIGYNRSARIIDMLESAGIIMPAEHGKIRKVIKQ